MLEKSNTKGKHLTIHDRTYIEDALNASYTLMEIASHLGKDSTTISKEIKKNRVRKDSKFELKGGCVNRKTCQQKHLCYKDCNRLCKKCTTLNCFRFCPDFTIKNCQRVNRFPHVCNGCEIKTTCKLDKYRYSAKIADANYRDKLTSARNGLNITRCELESLDDLISPLILKGQPIAHIYANHRNEIKCSERTLYNYIDMGLLSIRNIDLRRKVKYKPRKPKRNVKHKVSHRINKSYEDFCIHIAENPNQEVVEMDTVVGKKGGKVLLTLFIRKSSLMIAILLEKCTQNSVVEAIDKTYDDIGLDLFKSSFPILLTDNGSEFLDATKIEYDCDGNQRTKVFFCDPMASYQKPHLEKNHEFIRYVIPKGTSMDQLSQEKITLLMNHINSVSRKGLNNTTPFKLAQLLIDNKLLEALSFEEIHADDVHLKDELLDPTIVKKILLDIIK